MGASGIKKIINTSIKESYEKIFFPFLEPHLKAIFLNRPQRFLAEIALQEGTKTIAYCPNPGSLKGCLKAGSPALICGSNDPKRKRFYTLRAVKLKGVWLGLDTHLSNRLIEEALSQKLLPKLKAYKIFEREHSLGPGQRIDFLIKGPKGYCFLEVKSAIVVNDKIARFPDSITPRGLKHLKCLTLKAKAGHRAILLFLIQRSDVKAFAINQECYPAYYSAFKKAITAGVEVLAFSVAVNSKGFCAPKPIPVQE